MAWLGIVSQVASVGAQLIGSFLATSTEQVQGNNAPLANAREYHCELDDGHRWCVLARYVVIHKTRPELAGKAYRVGRVGDFDPLANSDPAVVFQLAQDDSNPPVNKLWAINTDPTSDYLVNFGNTDGSGNVAAPIRNLKKPVNKYKPTWVDVTGNFGDFPTGKLTVSPVNIPPSPTVLRALARHGVTASALTGEALVSNVQVDNVLGTARYILWAGTDAEGNVIQIIWSWTTDNDTNITGATVNNGSGENVAVTVILSWENPAQSFSKEFAAPVGTTTVTFDTQVGRPISNASISTTQENTAEDRLLCNHITRKQIANNEQRTVKYHYL